MPTTSNSSDKTADMIATASSLPVSTSSITFFRFILRLLSLRHILVLIFLRGIGRAILLRRHAGMLAKHIRKVMLTAKAAVACDHINLFG